MASRKGFTLIELLVVIGILAILLTITLIAVNPGRQFRQANDARRSSDINTILNAVGQYMADNRGALPPDMAPAGGTGVIADDTANDPTAAPVDICPDLITTYVSSFPVDPTTGTGGSATGEPIATCVAATAYNTGYSITWTNTGQVTVSATSELTGNPITVTR